MEKKRKIELFHSSISQTGTGRLELGTISVNLHQNDRRQSLRISVRSPERKEEHQVEYHFGHQNKMAEETRPGLHISLAQRSIGRKIMGARCGAGGDSKLGRMGRLRLLPQFLF